MSNRLNPNIGPTASPGRFAERVCCAGRLQAIGNDGAGQAESKSQCSHRPLLLRSLPPVIVPNGIPAVPVSGFNAKIPMTENCVSFAFPLYRDGKTARVLLSRYIGTGKLREFCLPAISGRENCASFAFPLYRDGKTARVLASRNIRAPKLSPRSFGDSA